MSGKSRTRREKVEEREAAIIAAAREIFSEHGFDGARMLEIAQRAEIAEGTLYLYFKNKQALLGAVIGDFYAELTAGAEGGVARIGPTVERLRFLALHHVDQCLQAWVILELLVGRYRQLSAYRSEGYLELNKSYVAVFDRVVIEGQHRGDLRDDVPLWLMRDQFYGTLEYAIRTMKIHDRRPDAVFDVLFDLICRGLARHRESAPQPPLEQVMRRLEAAAVRLEALHE